MKRAIAVGCGLLLVCTMLARGDEPATMPATSPATTPATTAKASSKPSTGPASKPATRPGRRTAENKAAEDAIKSAIVALTKEAQDTFKKKDAELPRQTSDYFKGQSPGIDQDTLLAALNRSLSRDPRVDAYIKLQLLSAVDKFDAAHAKPAINALVGAPALLPMPGMGQREQQEWDRKSMNVKEPEVRKINDEFKAKRAAGEAANAPQIAYRNALREKINVDDAMRPKLLQARVEELSQRAAAGFDTFAAWKDLATAIQTWSATASKKDIVEMRLFLADYAKRKGTNVYQELKWSRSERNPHAYWKDYPAVLNENRMADLIKALQSAEANAL